jgi:hypothetical protein
MAARVNVMFHPMGWGGHHITGAQNGGGIFEANTSGLQGLNQEFLCCRWKGNGRSTFLISFIVHPDCAVEDLECCF